MKRAENHIANKGKEKGNISNYLIARAQCFEDDKVEALEAENERSADYGHIDGHIDDQETINNYHFIHPKGHYTDLMSPYLINGTGAGGKKKAKKTACVESVIVTASPNFFDNLSDVCVRQFFKDASDCLLEKFGKMNVFSSVVHMDEGTPHLHFNFFPYNEDGTLMGIATLEGESLKELQSDLYERVGKPWRLQRGCGKFGDDMGHREDYEQARLMYTYTQEVTDVITQLQAMRDEVRKVEGRMLETQKQKDAMVESILQMREEEKALRKEKARLAEEIRKDTDFHAAIDLACAEENPYRNKKKAIRVLKARNCALGQQLAAGNAENGNLLRRLQETEAKLRAAEAFKAKADIADKIREKHPDIWEEAAKEQEPGRKRAYRRSAASSSKEKAKR